MVNTLVPGTYGIDFRRNFQIYLAIAALGLFSPRWMTYEEWQGMAHEKWFNSLRPSDAYMRQ